MKTKILEIKDIKIDEKIYPRKEVNEGIVKEYTKQMGKGVVFPPIYVAWFGNKYILIDGRHRLEANKSKGEKYIQTEINDKFTDVSEILVASVRANERHGLRLNQTDKIKIAYSMRDMEFDVEQITELTGITLGTFNKNVLGKFRKVEITRKIKEGKMPKIFSEVVKKEEEKGEGMTKEEQKELAKKYKIEWQLDELEGIYEYFKITEFDTDDKGIENIISKIKKVLHKRFPKL